MRKVLVITFALALTLGSAVASAADPTVINVTWGSGSYWFNGAAMTVVSGTSGSLNINVTAHDDASARLFTFGGNISGVFDGTITNTYPDPLHPTWLDGPYNYGVESTTFSTKSNVNAGGGGIEFVVNRTDSKTSMYGPAGQVSATTIFSTDGTAFLGRRTTTNYASAKNCNYSFQSNNQYSAAGTSFFIDHSINSGDGDTAGVGVYNATGSATITSMSDELGGYGFRLGRGCGCYDNASGTGTGSGTYELWANAANSLSGNGWSSGGGSYLQQIIYTGGFSITNTYVDGN